MDAFDAGPFDNSEAGAFGVELEEAESGLRMVLVRQALEAVLVLDVGNEAAVDRVQPRAFAAASVVGAHRQGGPPAGAAEPPEFLQDAGDESLSGELVELAVRAMDQIDASGTPWAAFWIRTGSLACFRDCLTD